MQKHSLQACWTERCTLDSSWSVRRSWLWSSAHRNKGKPSEHSWAQSELKLRFWKETSANRFCRVQTIIAGTSLYVYDLCGLTWSLLCWFCRCSYRSHRSLLQILPQTQYTESTFARCWAPWERKYQSAHGKGYEEQEEPRTARDGEKSGPLWVTMTKQAVIKLLCIYNYLIRQMSAVLVHYGGLGDLQTLAV